MSTPAPNRYDANPIRLQGKRDIVEHLLGLMNRIGSEETSLQVGHTAIEDGNLTVRNGDIIVSETDDTVVLRLIHGSIPQIRFFPLGEVDTHFGILYANDFLDEQFLTLAVLDAATEDPDGGGVILRQSTAQLVHTPLDTSLESGIVLNVDGDTTPAMFYFKGRWPNQIQYEVTQALYMGSFVASSGVSTWTHTYFSPFSTTMVPVCTVLHAGSTIQWGLESFSASAFTVRFSSTTNAKTINFWNFRV